MNPTGPSSSYPDQRPGSSRDATAVERGAGDDLPLLARMRSGDERALGELYDRWKNRVYSLALAMLRDSGEAEDITEETFWQAWRQADRFESGRGSAGSWLLTIARSRALDRLRARKRRPEETLEEGDDDDRTFVDTTAGPAEGAEANERETLIRTALATLPSEQKQALELAYFGGLSQSEISEKTGAALGTVKTRMRLALGKLRGLLEPLRDDDAGRTEVRT